MTLNLHTAWHDHWVGDAVLKLMVPNINFRDDHLIVADTLLKALEPGTHTALPADDQDFISAVRSFS